MKSFLLLLSVLLLFPPGLSSCSTDEAELPAPTEQPAQPTPPSTSEEPDNDGSNNNSPTMKNQLSIHVGTTSFNVSLENNATAIAFKALLPLTPTLSEMNGNEKLFYLAADLPTASSRPGTIRAGDLMLYGSNCLVLFYETFSSAYSYTRLGRVNNPAGLADALGSGSVTVRFELTDN